MTTTVLNHEPVIGEIFQSVGDVHYQVVRVIETYQGLGGQCWKCEVRRWVKVTVPGL